TVAIGNVSVDMPASWSEEDRRIASSVITHLRSDLAQRLRTVDQLERVVDDASALDTAANALRLDVRITALELDQLVATELWQWLGPGSIQMETRFVDAASGRVVLATADRRTARTVMTETRDIPGTTARLAGLVIAAWAMAGPGPRVARRETAAARPNAATKLEVTISEFAFHPRTLEVSAGATVTWTNADGDAHTVTSENGAFTSPAL